MGCEPPALLSSLRCIVSSSDALPTLLSAGASARPRIAKQHRYHDKAAGKASFDPEQFVQIRIDQGVDFIKFASDAPGFSTKEMDAMVVKARKHGLKTVAHAFTYDGYVAALNADAHLITHVPMANKEIERCGVMAARMRLEGKIAVPTLAMIEQVCANGEGGHECWKVASKSVSNLIAAGINVFVGSDVGSPTQGVKAELTCPGQ